MLNLYSELSCYRGTVGVGYGKRGPSRLPKTTKLKILIYSYLQHKTQRHVSSPKLLYRSLINNACCAVLLPSLRPIMVDPSVAVLHHRSLRRLAPPLARWVPARSSGCLSHDRSCPLSTRAQPSPCEDGLPRCERVGLRLTEAHDLPQRPKLLQFVAQCDACHFACALCTCCLFVQCQVHATSQLATPGLQPLIFDVFQRLFSFG
jgi:hypothetical protein